MKKYHKINSIFKRDMTNNGKFILGEYSCPEFKYLKDNEWVFTEKIDGTNIRVMFDGETIKFGGKSDNAQIQVALYDKLNEIFKDSLSIFKETFINSTDNDTEVCLYGEGYGAKIQKAGGNYINDGVDFILFDIKIGQSWLSREDVEDIANKLNLRVVKTVGTGTLNDCIELVTTGFNSEFGDFIAEGIVARPTAEMLNRRHQRIIAKIKHIDFLK